MDCTVVVLLLQSNFVDLVPTDLFFADLYQPSRRTAAEVARMSALVTTLYIQHGKAKAKINEVTTALAAALGRSLPIGM